MTLYARDEVARMAAEDAPPELSAGARILSVPMSPAAALLIMDLAGMAAIEAEVMQTPIPLVAGDIGAAPTTGLRDAPPVYPDPMPHPFIGNAATCGLIGCGAVRTTRIHDPIARPYVPTSHAESFGRCILDGQPWPCAETRAVTAKLVREGIVDPVVAHRGVS